MDWRKILQSTIGDQESEGLQSPLLDPLDALPLGVAANAVGKLGAKGLAKKTVQKMGSVGPDPEILARLQALQKNKPQEGLIRASDKIQDLIGEGEEYLMDTDGSIRAHFINGNMRGAMPRPAGIDEITKTPAMGDGLKAAGVAGAAMGLSQEEEEDPRFKQLKQMLGR